MNITAMIQYFGHAIHAQGDITYRAVEIELTPEQADKLMLRQDEAYGVFAVTSKQEMIGVKNEPRTIYRLDWRYKTGSSRP